MKKIVLLFALLVGIASNGYAQWVGWTPLPHESVTLPDIVIPDPPVISQPVTPPAPRLIESELVDANCYDFRRQEILKVKIRIEKYSNGDNMLLFVGKKINNEWVSVDEVHLLSIESMLSGAETEEQKSTLLQLSESFHYIAVDKNENFYGF